MKVRAWVKLTGNHHVHEETIELDNAEFTKESGSDLELDVDKLDDVIAEWKNEVVEWGYDVVEEDEGGGA